MPSDLPHRPIVVNRPITAQPDWPCPQIRQMIAVALAEGENVFGWLAALNHVGGRRVRHGRGEPAELRRRNPRHPQRQHRTVPAAVGTAGGDRAGVGFGHRRQGPVHLRPQRPRGPRRRPPGRGTGLRRQDDRTPCIWRACCTTSARSASTTACSARRESSPTRSTSTSSSTWRSATTFSTIWRSWKRSCRWCCTTTNRGTAAAIRTSSAAKRIPLAARIVAVADAFDAMSSDRPYRKGMPEEQVDQILRTGAGQQWDPEVIDAFFRVREDIRRMCRERAPALGGRLRQPRTTASPTAVPRCPTAGPWRTACGCSRPRPASRHRPCGGFPRWP